jgi:hypothetical protein
MEWKEKRKEEVGTLKVYGKQVMYMMGDDKTEVKSLALPETKKVAMLLASMLTMSKIVLFGKNTKQLASLSLQESAAMQVHAGALACGRM